MSCKLSIVTINYNNKKGLVKTMESVFQQTFSQFEYIVIDGGSTDGSVDVINNYKNRLHYWISEPDKGIYNAMNKGIVKASGDYVQLLNSGDWLCNNDTLQQVFDGTDNADIIYGNMLKVYTDGKIVNDKGFKRSDLTLADMFFHTLNHSSSFIKRKLFDTYGLYNEEYKIISDWAFFLKTIGLGDVSVHYKDIDVNYFDMTGVSNTQLDLRYTERRIELEKTIKPQIRKDYEELRRLQGRVRILDKIKNNQLIYVPLKTIKNIFSR